MTALAGEMAEFFFPNFRYKWIFEETCEKLPLEIDFRLEAKNAQKCKEIFKGHNTIKVPKVYEQFTGPRVLVMSFEKGVSVTQVKELSKSGVDLKKVAHAISEAFVHMIFKEGFVHGDPHPGNMFVRPKEDNSGEIELVLLDHGIYSNLNEDTRINYAKLWRGILNQDEPLIRESSLALGADLYDLFAAMVEDRKYEDLMDESKKHNLKSRLKDLRGEEARQERIETMNTKEREIAECLRDMKRELLLVLKTNQYLRSIDVRLGNPTNTFN